MRNRKNQLELEKQSLENKQLKVNIFSSLVEAFGGSIASQVFGVLSGTAYTKELLEITKLVNENFPIKEAMQKVFGDKYNEIMVKAKQAPSFIYEVDRDNYKLLEIDKNLSLQEKIILIRTEFNLNIQELASKGKDKNLQGHALMILNKWISRYGEIIGFESIKEKEKFIQIAKVLDPNTKSFKDLYKILKPLFGVSAVMSMIYALLLFTGLGMGIWANISIFVVGVPGGQIAGVVLLSSILASLAFIDLSTASKIQAVIQAIYRILDEKEVRIGNNNILLEEELILQELNTLIDKDDKNDNLTKETIISIVAIIKYMILADGDVDDKEYEIYSEFTQKEFALTQEDVMEYWKKTPKIEGTTTLDILGEVLKKEQKEMIISLLKKIIIADGTIHANERRFLQEVKRSFK